MELRPTSKKKKGSSLNFKFLPPIVNPPIFNAYFNGVSCCVKDRSSMETLFKLGFFGKGSLSKSFPTFSICDDDFPEFLHEQQWLNRKNNTFEPTVRSLSSHQRRKRALAEKSIINFRERIKKQNRKYEKKVTTLPYLTKHIPLWNCSCTLEKEEPNNHFKTMVKEILKNYTLSLTLNKGDNPLNHDEAVVVDDKGNLRLEDAVGAPKEELYLSLQESFFLAGTLHVLNVFDITGKQLTKDEMWLAFQKSEPDFLKKYLVYHWYRSKGWVVRSGFIYGGDFVLYEKGPSHTHSSYVIRVLDQENTLTWNELASLTRLCETVQKDVVYCTVVPPDNVSPEELKSPSIIKSFKVLEVMHRRWIPTHHLNSQEVSL